MDILCFTRKKYITLSNSLIIYFFKLYDFNFLKNLLKTFSGRGDIGKQFAAGALGFGIFAPIIGGPGNGLYLNAMICFTVLIVLAVIILLVDE